jgi:methionyl aminopeptidase
MIRLKSSSEIEKMKSGGKISKNALDLALKMCEAGTELLEIDREVEKFILRHGAKPSFKMVSGYAHSTCININDGLVHGIPNKYKIKVGDLVKVDLGVFYDGFHTDTSGTVEVGSSNESIFLKAGRECIQNAVQKCRIGNRIGDISSEMQKTIEKYGFSVSRSLVGHGIGRELHEDPLVPGFGKSGTGLVLQEGLVLAIEIIYQKGSYQIKTLSDKWTIATKDGSLGGLFEDTVAITRLGPIILTK